jgi:hypothetical protein
MTRHLLYDLTQLREKKEKQPEVEVNKRRTVEPRRVITNGEGNYYCMYPNVYCQYASKYGICKSELAPDGFKCPGVKPSVGCYDDIYL